MTISHHLDEATIMAFAAGTLGEAHGVVVSAHLGMCATCRASVRQAEALGGQIMVEQEAQAVSDTCRAATLASLDGVGVARPQAKAHGTAQSPSDMPAALRRYLGDVAFSDLNWRKRAPGVAKVAIELAPGGKTHLQLLRLGRGRAMPDHGHGGAEITLVLKGSYSDHTGRYGRGDVADFDEEIEHQPVVDSDEDCICLIATEAPTRFKSIWARLAQPFVGI